MRPFKKVLLIDDDDIVNSINSVIIKHAKFAKDVVASTSVPEALQLLKKEDQGDEFPEIIFLDLNMPSLDGWDFIDEYEKLGSSTKSKVIMLTSSISVKDEKRAASLEGVTAYVSKPLSPELLEEIYTKFLG